MFILAGTQCPGKNNYWAFLLHRRLFSLGHHDPMKKMVTGDEPPGRPGEYTHSTLKQVVIFARTHCPGKNKHYFIGVYVSINSQVLSLQSMEFTYSRVHNGHEFHCH